MSVPLNPKQQKQGIKDSVDLMVADMTKAGRGFNHPDLARKFAENAVNICPMLDECGVQLMDKVIRLGGHSAPRTMVPTAPQAAELLFLFTIGSRRTAFSSVTALRSLTF